MRSVAGEAARAGPRTQRAPNDPSLPCRAAGRQVEVARVTTIQQLVDHSNAARSTGSTGANSDSSRSHSIMQVRPRRPARARPARPEAAPGVYAWAAPPLHPRCGHRMQGLSGAAAPQAVPAAVPLSGPVPTPGPRGCSARSRQCAVLAGRLPLKAAGSTCAQFALKRRGEGEGGRQIGKITFIDLAGSERGADTYENDRRAPSRAPALRQMLGCVPAASGSGRCEHIHPCSHMLRDGSSCLHSRQAQVAGVRGGGE